MLLSGQASLGSVGQASGLKTPAGANAVVWMENPFFSGKPPFLPSRPSYIPRVNRSKTSANTFTAMPGLVSGPETGC